MLIHSGGSSFKEAILVCVISIVVLVQLGKLYPNEITGERYLGITSESMVQTIPANILRDKPLQAIYFNHIQPPMLDSVRAVIAFFWNPSHGSLVQFIDLGLTRLYIGLFGILTALLFLWILKATESRVCAWVGALIWMVHPSPLSMSFFLDGTFLSSFFVSWMIFEIWLISKREGSVSRLIIVAVLCFLTRAHFQWFFVPVLGILMLFVGVDRRRILLGMAILCFVVGLYCVKQYMLFGTVYSFGWMGTQLAGSVWIEDVGERTNYDYKEACGGQTIISRDRCEKYLSERYPTEVLAIDFPYPKGAQAVSGGYNTEDRWWLSQVKTRIAKQVCFDNLGSCIGSLWRSLLQNYPEYWVETWDRRNPMVSDDAGIPWMGISGRIVHNYPWFILGAVVILLTVVTGRWRETEKLPILGVAVMPAYVFSITLLGNNYDAFEGGRLKFLLEPAIYVFIVVQVFYALRYIYLGSREEMVVRK